MGRCDNSIRCEEDGQEGSDQGDEVDKGGMVVLDMRFQRFKESKLQLHPFQTQTVARKYTLGCLNE